MKNRFIKTASLALVSCFALTGCGKDSIPKEGYKKFIEHTYEAATSNGLKKENVKFKSCNYAMLTASGDIDIETLAGNVYYKFEWSITISDYTSPEVSYGVYYSKDKLYDSLNSSTAYNYAVSLIKDGSLKGEIGSL